MLCIDTHIHKEQFIYMTFENRNTMRVQYFNNHNQNKKVYILFSLNFDMQDKCAFQYFKVVVVQDYSSFLFFF